MDRDIITKDMKIGEIAEKLDDYCIPHPRGGEIVMAMLLNECDYIRIKGYGRTAVFEQVIE